MAACPRAFLPHPFLLQSCTSVKGTFIIGKMDMAGVASLWSKVCMRKCKTRAYEGIDTAISYCITKFDAPCQLLGVLLHRPSQAEGAPGLDQIGSRHANEPRDQHRREEVTVPWWTGTVATTTTTWHVLGRHPERFHLSGVQQKRDVLSDRFGHDRIWGPRRRHPSLVPLQQRHRARAALGVTRWSEPTRPEL